MIKIKLYYYPINTKFNFFQYRRSCRQEQCLLLLHSSYHVFRPQATRYFYYIFQWLHLFYYIIILKSLSQQLRLQVYLIEIQLLLEVSISIQLINLKLKCFLKVNFPQYLSIFSNLFYSSLAHLNAQSPFGIFNFIVYLITSHVTVVVLNPSKELKQIIFEIEVFSIIFTIALLIFLVFNSQKKQHRKEFQLWIFQQRTNSVFSYLTSQQIYILKQLPQISLCNDLKESLNMSECNMNVEIQICSNCQSHQWCTRHKEASYSSLAMQIKKCLQQHDKNINIQIFQVSGQKMGSFEVYCNGVVLFSKLSLGYFPHTPSVVARILSFIDDSRKGADLKKYSQAKHISPNRTIQKSGGSFIIESPKKQSNKSPQKRVKYDPTSQNLSEVKNTKSQNKQVHEKKNNPDQSTKNQKKHEKTDQHNKQEHKKQQKQNNKEQNKKDEIRKEEHKKEQLNGQQIIKGESKKDQNKKDQHPKQLHKSQNHNKKQDHNKQLIHHQENKKQQNKNINQPKKQEKHQKNQSQTHQDKTKLLENKAQKHKKQNKNEQAQFLLKQQQGDNAHPHINSNIQNKAQQKKLSQKAHENPLEKQKKQIQEHKVQEKQKPQQQAKPSAKIQNNQITNNGNKQDQYKEDFEGAESKKLQQVNQTPQN